MNNILKNFVALVLFCCFQYGNTQNYQTIEEIDNACATLSFSGNEEAEIAVDEILQKIGLFRNFVLQECPDINNAVAKIIEVSEGTSERFILYDNDFLNMMNDKASTDWAAMSILAHEIGHHLNGHSLNNKGSNYKFELEADYFSGYAMAKLGASLSESQSAINSLRYEKATRTHPAKKDRLTEIKKGWQSADNTSDRKEEILPKTTESIILYESDLKLRDNLIDEARTFQDNGQIEKVALNMLKAFQYGAGKFPEDLYYAANAYVVAKNYQKAQFYYKLLEKNGIEKLNKDQQNEVYQNIGLIALELGDEKEAIAYFDFLLKKDPKNSKIRLARAYVYYQDGNLQKFRDELIRLTQFDPNNYDYCYNLGVAYYELGNYEKAFEYYEKAIAIDSQQFSALLNLGALILSKEMSIVEKMNSLGTSHEDNNTHDALSEIRLNIYKQALYYLESAYELNPNQKDLVKTMMNIYAQLGNTKKQTEFSKKLSQM